MCVFPVCTFGLWIMTPIIGSQSYLSVALFLPNNVLNLLINNHQIMTESKENPFFLQPGSYLCIVLAVSAIIYNISVTNIESNRPRHKNANIEIITHC